MDDDSIETISKLKLKPKSIKVIYCGNCSLPFEYCEFGSNPSKCKVWLKENHPEFFENEVEEESREKAEVEGTPSANAQDKKKKASQNQKKKIVITIIERTKRKRVTHVLGLDLFDVDLKKASKLFAGKFAASSSVSKNGAGKDEIVIQGDCSFELIAYILQIFPSIKENDVEIVEGKKK